MVVIAPRSPSAAPWAAVPSATVLALLLAVTVMALTVFGTLDTLPSPLRGAIQAVGTLAGIYLGAHWQARDQREAAAGSGRAALVNVVALAGNVQALLDTSANFRLRLAQSPPRTIDALQNATDAVLIGMDGHAKGILMQAQAAAQAWLPLIPDGEAYLRRIGDSSGASEPNNGSQL